MLRLPAGELQTIQETWYMMAAKGQKISQSIYWFLIEKQSPEYQGSMLLWSQDLNKNFDKKEWSKLCALPWKTTLLTKLRLFQYKITQRCLVTNVNLFYYKIRDSKKCTFCGRDDETIIHLFIECHIVQDFWRRVIDIFKFKFNDNRLNSLSPVSKHQIIFNTVSGHPCDYLNTLLLIAKRHIYVARCYKEKPNVNAYIKQIVNYIEIERYIAIKNRKIEKHEQKWSKVTLNP